MVKYIIIVLALLFPAQALACEDTAMGTLTLKAKSKTIRSEVFVATQTPSLHSVHKYTVDGNTVRRANDAAEYLGGTIGTAVDEFKIKSQWRGKVMSLTVRLTDADGCVVRRTATLKVPV